MALTKVTGQVINTSTDVTVGVLTVTNTLAVGGTVSIGGTLTYEDVTNIDSVGLITARNGIVVGSGITLSKDGDIFATGVTTATTFVGALTGNVTGNVTGNISGGTVAGSTGTFTGDVNLGDDDNLYLGASNDLRIYHAAGAGSHINNTGLLNIDGTTGVRLEYNNATRVDCTSTGVSLVGDVDVADKIIHTGDTNTAIRFPSADTITFETAGSERLRIDSNGNLGIGAAPTSGFNLSITDAGNPAFRIEDTDASNSIFDLSENNGEAQLVSRGPSSTNGTFVFYQHDGSTLSVAAKIDAAGRLMLGTTTLGYADADDFTIATAGNTGMTIRAGTSNYSSIFFADDTSGGGSYDGFLQYGHTDQKFLIGTGGTGNSDVSIDSNGYVGMGGENSQHLYYSKTLVVNCSTEGDGGGITIRSGTTSHTNYLMFADSSIGAARYDAYVGYAHNVQKMYLATAGASKVELDSSGNMTLSAGNLVIGNNDKGIDFSATEGSGATASILDDYEEGTWTPALSNGTGITVHTATYTKVGRKVTIHAYVTINNNSSSGTLVFVGLPYNEGNLSYPLGAAYTQNTGSIHVFNQVAKNGNYTEVLKNVGNNILQSDVSGGYVLFSNTYFTA